NSRHPNPNGTRARTDLGSGLPVSDAGELERGGIPGAGDQSPGGVFRRLPGIPSYADDRAPAARCLPLWTSPGVHLEPRSGNYSVCVTAGTAVAPEVPGARCRLHAEGAP